MNITFRTLPKPTALIFEYQFYPTAVGNILLVSYQQSLVYIAFATPPGKALAEAKARFPKATFLKKETPVQKQAVQYLAHPLKYRKTIPVTLMGSPFQIKVWKKLEKIPFSTTCFYSDLAKSLKQPTAVRAVASAVARNPLAILIPCHRVLPRSGGIGKYHWGTKNKSTLLTWERILDKK